MEGSEDAAYGKFRRIASVVIVGLITIAVVGDVLIPTYHVDSITLGLLIGALLVLLGVDAGQWFLRR